MAGQERILCIDIGADSIKMSEFSCTSENIEMENFVYSEYTNDSDDATAQEAMIYALKEMLANNDFKAKKTFVAITGQDALIPFIKIPAMTTDPEKIQELVTYEAASRIPYPLNEVTWDYQLIEDQDGGDEIDAMLVSVKNEEVLAIREALIAAGKKVVSIEVSPTALYNSARANGIGDSQCEMILNIGGKSSTLIFLDGPRFFIRTIPVAGNAITQQIAKEFNMSFADADEIKRRHGFVALGGAYEEPESDVAATVSKIIRNVMTRLHGEINRSINVYRASQHGRKPEKMYLAGGSSVMAFTPRFFVEKLRIPVDYFNAFQVINLSPEVNQEMLQEQAHLCGETIGLAMRSFRSTPVEIALVPETVKKQARMRQKLPYFYAAAAVVLIYLGISWWSLGQQVSELEVKERSMNMKLAEKRDVRRQVENAKKSQKESLDKHEYIKNILLKRNEFLSVMDKIQAGYVAAYLSPGNDAMKTQLWFSNIVYSNERQYGTAERKEVTREDQRNNRQANADAVAEEDENRSWLNFKGYIVTAKDQHYINVLEKMLGVLGQEFPLEKDDDKAQYYTNDEMPEVKNLSAFTISWPLTVKN